VFVLASGSSGCSARELCSRVYASIVAILGFISRAVPSSTVSLVCPVSTSIFELRVSDPKTKIILSYNNSLNIV
jgi:hypothetical protein